MSPSKNKCASRLSRHRSASPSLLVPPPLSLLAGRPLALFSPNSRANPRDPHAASERASASFPLSNASTKPSTPPRSRPGKARSRAPKDLLELRLPRRSRRRRSRRAEELPRGRERRRVDTTRGLIDIIDVSACLHDCLATNSRAAAFREPFALAQKPAYARRRARRGRFSASPERGGSRTAGRARRLRRVTRRHVARRLRESVDVDRRSAARRRRVGRRESVSFGEARRGDDGRRGCFPPAERRRRRLRRLSRRAHGERRTRAALFCCAASTPWSRLRTRARRGRVSASAPRRTADARRRAGPPSSAASSAVASRDRPEPRR